MVFRGKPSKACERCRKRRLKCDFHPAPCGQCVRANAPCSGYRDTKQLRIQNESQAIILKAMSQPFHLHVSRLPVSIESQARDAFFSFYVSGKCWDFLEQFYNSPASTDYLRSAIQAVSSAYFWAKSGSTDALEFARRSYVSALRMTSKTLKSPKEATKDIMLLTALLLDLYEKITESKPRRNASWTSHVNGALALVRLRGTSTFQSPLEVRLLVHLSRNYIASYIANESLVPVEMISIQEYLGQHLNASDPTWRMTAMMIQYAKLRNDERRGILSGEQRIQMILELDIRLQTLDIEIPPAWQFSTKSINQISERSFDLYYTTHSNRNICQARNILRLVRMLLNESLIDHYLTMPPADGGSTCMTGIYNTIDTLAREIFATVPQYLDCEGAARQRLPSVSAQYLHTPNHLADCYSLIFPLYAVGRSKVSAQVRTWASMQLHHLATHFCIRKAELVVDILEKEANTCPWKVYALLGSYAFSA